MRSPILDSLYASGTLFFITPHSCSFPLPHWYPFLYHMKPNWYLFLLSTTIFLVLPFIPPSLPHFSPHFLPHLFFSFTVYSEGNTLEFFLSPTHDAEAAKRFFLK